MVNWKKRIVRSFAFASLLVASAGWLQAATVRSSGGSEWEGDKTTVKETPPLQVIANVPVEFIRENAGAQVTQFCQVCAFRGKSEIPVDKAKIRVTSGYRYSESASTVRTDPSLSIGRYVTGAGGCVSWNETARSPRLRKKTERAQMDVTVEWRNSRKADRTSVVCQVRWTPGPAVGE